MSDPDSTTKGDGDYQPPAKVVWLEELERTVSESVKKSLGRERASGIPGQVQA